MMELVLLEGIFDLISGQSHLFANLNPLLRVPALMYFLVPIGVMLGAAFYFWESLKVIFGKIPFIGELF